MFHVFLPILIAYLPFQIALNPYPDIDLMSGRVLILIIFFYWLWTIRNSLRVVLPKFFNFQSIFLTIFLFFAFFSLFGAQEVFWGIRKILVFCSIFPLYLLVVYFSDNFEKIKKIIRILVFASLPITLIGIFQFSSQFIFLPGQVTNFWSQYILPVFSGRAFGWLVSAFPSWLFEIGGRFYIRAISLFPDPHTFAFYLGLITPLALSLLILTKENKKLLFVISCLLFINLFLTFSRGGYFAFFLTATFFLCFFLFRLNLSRKYYFLFSLFYLLFLIFLLVPITPIAECFYSAFDFSRHSNIERFQVWQEALELISQNPWLGVGIGNFPRAVDPWAKYLSPINAHSLYLDIASEMGIFALWAWLILFLGTIYSLFKTKNPWALGIAGSLIWFSLHAIVETPIYNPTILAILMVILGLSTAISKNINKISNS